MQEIGKPLVINERLFFYNLMPVSIAAVVDRAVFHPMETIITLRQDSNKAIPKIVRSLANQGIASFYPGYLPAILSAIPIRVSIYSTYFFIKDLWQDQKIFTPTQVMIAAGMLSGVAEAAILCPSESYRTRKTLGVSTFKPYSLKVLYSGFFPLVTRTSLENTICLVGSDLMLQLLPVAMRSNFTATYFTGLIAGMLSQLIGGPIDVLKTRVMKEHNSGVKLKQHVYDLWNERSFFRGVASRAIRAGICNSMILGTTTVIQKIIHNYENDEKFIRPQR